MSIEYNLQTCVNNLTQDEKGKLEELRQRVNNWTGEEITDEFKIERDSYVNDITLYR